MLWTAEKEEEAKEGREKEEEGASSKRPQSRWAGGLRRVDRLVVCPARAGRLLRFAGDTYHSVPRPANAYLDWDAGGTGGRIHTRAPRTPGDHESTAMRRSVILFNTWQDPPEGFGGGDEEEEGGGAAAAAAAEQESRGVMIALTTPAPSLGALGRRLLLPLAPPLCRSAATTTATRSVRKVPLGDRQRLDPSTTTLRWSADGAAAIAKSAHVHDGHRTSWPVAAQGCTGIDKIGVTINFPCGSGVSTKYEHRAGGMSAMASARCVV